MYNVTDSVKKMLAVSRKKERKKTMGGTVLFHVSRSGHPKCLVIRCPQFVWNMNSTEIALLSLQIQKEMYYKKRRIVLYFLIKIKKLFKNIMLC